MTTFGSSNNNPSCEHFVGIDENKISPTATECEKCEKEGIDWVALSMCLVCGHAGCCDSSVGLYATKHFNNSGIPLLTDKFKPLNHNPRLVYDTEYWIIVAQGTFEFFWILIRGFTRKFPYYRGKTDRG